MPPPILSSVSASRFSTTVQHAPNMQQATPEQAVAPAPDFDYTAEIEELESKANTSYTLAQHSEAEETYRRLIGIRGDQEGVGATHLDRYNLAAALAKQRRLTGTEPMLRETLSFLTSRTDGRGDPNFVEKEAGASALLAGAQIGQDGSAR